MGFDEEYREKRAYFGVEPESILEAHGGRIPRGSRVLDVGAGQGRNALYVASLGHEVDALDPSAVGLEQLREAAREAELDVRTWCADLGSFVPEVEGYGAILAFGLIPVLGPAEVELFVARACDWTLTPGLLFVTAFTTRDPFYAEVSRSWSSIGELSFESPEGKARTYLRPGQLPELFPDFRIHYFRERQGPEHAHGDGPVHCHNWAEAVLER